MGGPCIVDGESRDELDNWFKCRIQLDGKVWPSAEHYYQAAKYPGDEEHQEAIRRAPNGTHCWSLGQEERPSLRKDWDEVKVEFMYDANRAKFTQNRELRKLLVSTSGPITAQGSVFWKTWNEVLLERLREELRDYEEQDSRALGLRFNMMKNYQRVVKTGNSEAITAATSWAAKRQLPPKLPEMPTAKSKCDVECIEPTVGTMPEPSDAKCSEAESVAARDMSTDSLSSEVEPIKAVFKRFDLNKNGVIEKDELTQLLQELDAETWTTCRCGLLLRKMDIDKDGVLSYNEFVDWAFDSGTENRLLRQDFRTAVDRIQPGCFGESVVAAAPRMSLHDARAVLGTVH